MIRQHTQHRDNGLTDRYTMQRMCVSIYTPKNPSMKSKEDTNETIALLLAREIIKADAIQLRSSTSAGLFFNKETYYIYVAKTLVKEIDPIYVDEQPNQIRTTLDNTEQPRKQSMNDLFTKPTSFIHDKEYIPIQKTPFIRSGVL